MMLCYFCMHEKGDAAVCPYCHMQGEPVPLAHQLRPGTIIGGRYLVGRVLGEGGFGITYLGCYPKLDMTVAVKEYYPNGMAYRSNDGTDSVYVRSQDTAEFFRHGKERFLSEARTLARFKSEPGIVSVLDFIEENGTAYLIMEYLDGMTLQQYLKQRGTMSADEAFTLLRPAMQTLDKVHAAGVIHRDISPDNIMRLHSGQLKLMDFGAAREYTDDHKSLSVMLKKGYAPAEQYNRKGEQGPWTDVYALCATIYRCITGKAPSDSLDRVFEDDLIPPSQLGATITPAQEKVLLKGLAIKKQDRWQNIAELIDQWERSSRIPAYKAVQPPTVNPIKTVAADREMPINQVSVTDPHKTIAADGETSAVASNYADRYTQAAPSSFGLQEKNVSAFSENVSQKAEEQNSVLKKRENKVRDGLIGAIVFLVIIAAVVVLIIRSNTGFEYDINDTVTIIRYKGHEKDVTIPNEIKGKPVTTIAENAFLSKNMETVTIPATVTTIEDEAFNDCENLTSVNITDSVTSVGEKAFSGCKSLTSVTIGNSVTSIGIETFLGCSSLTSVTIGDSVSSIGRDAFSKCSSLTSVTIPDSVTSIGDRAFFYCSNGFTIYGKTGSEAERYANDHYYITFKSID